MIINGKNVIKIIIVLQRAHQIYMEVRKTALEDGDGLGNQVCVAVNLAPLAGQTPACPSSDIPGRPRHTNLDEIIRREASLLG